MYEIHFILIIEIVASFIFGVLIGRWSTLKKREKLYNELEQFRFEAQQNFEHQSEFAKTMDKIKKAKQVYKPE